MLLSTALRTAKLALALPGIATDAALVAWSEGSGKFVEGVLLAVYDA